MITQLTQQQIDQFPKFVDKWIKIGTQTGPCDREACMKIADQIAKMHDLPKIENYYFYRSPIEAVHAIMKEYNVSKSDAFKTVIYGYNESWLSFYDYFLEETDIQLTDKIKPLIALAKVCGWWSYIGNNVYFQDRPEFIHMENGLLHCEDGPSIRFSDGFCVWSLEGHRVTEQIVMHPETLTLQQIHDMTNADIQAIMLQRFGWSRYLEETNAKQIDARHNDIENTVEILYDSGTFGYRLVCTCPTGRVFVKGVHNSVSTCEEAQYWLSGYQLSNRKKFRTIGRT